MSRAPCMGKRTAGVRWSRQDPPGGRDNCTGHLPMGNALWLIIVVLVVLWLAGFLMQVGGGLIHTILVIAVILIIIKLVTGKRVV